jgi:uncharacterized protein (TIGR00725 family)
MAAKRKPLIAVIGAGECSGRMAGLAEDVGREIARRGSVLVCGGLGGVMEAAARGAKAGGGQTVGILPGSDPGQANAYIDIPIATGIGYIRNIFIVRAADGVIAIGGKEGTLSEVAYSLIEKKPLVSLESWEVDPSILKAKDPQEAVALIFQMLGNEKGRR